MAMTQTSVVVGVFSDHPQARHAIDALQRAGFSDQEIGFLTRAGSTETSEDTSANAATGALEGGLLGSILGAAASLLIPGIGPALAGGILIATLGGAALGAAAGGLIGVFTSLGVSDNDARFYQDELTAGRSIVTVKASTGLDDAATILRENGASDVRTHEGVINAIPPQRPYGAPSDTYDPTIDDTESTGRA